MVRVAPVTLFFIATVPLSCSAARLSTESNDEFHMDVTTDWGRRSRVGVDQPAQFNCGSEYTLGGMGSDRLPDLLTHAHEWCRSDSMPEDQRVPEVLRGLFWMKDLTLSDIAFCGSLGEWNAETLTARLPVWSSFVVGKKPEEEVPALIEAIAGQGLHPSALILGRHALVYSITFTNSSLTEAQISPSHNLFDRVSNFPMLELQTTADGSLSSERPGDIFSRPSFFFGRETAPYEAVKVMYDDGTLHMDRVSAMRAAKINDPVTYMRYAPTC